MTNAANPFEAPPIAIYGTPPDDSADPHPAFAFQYDLLYRQCCAALDRRTAAYPELIRKGQIDPALAADDITGWQLLCAEWRWILTGEGELPGAETLPRRIAAVELAASRITTQIDRTAPSHELWAQQSAVIALAWHLARLRHGNPAVHRLAAMTRNIRALMVIRQCPICDRNRADPATRACTRTDCGLALRAVPGAARIASDLANPNPQQEQAA